MWTFHRLIATDKLNGWWLIKLVSLKVWLIDICTSLWFTWSWHGDAAVWVHIICNLTAVMLPAWSLCFIFSLVYTFIQFCQELNNNVNNAFILTPIHCRMPYRLYTYIYETATTRLVWGLLRLVPIIVVMFNNELLFVHVLFCYFNGGTCLKFDKGGKLNRPTNVWTLTSVYWKYAAERLVWEYRA